MRFFFHGKNIVIIRYKHYVHVHIAYKKKCYYRFYCDYTMSLKFEKKPIFIFCFTLRSDCIATN